MTKTSPQNTSSIRSGRPQSELAERIDELFDRCSRARVHPALRVVGIVIATIVSVGIWMARPASPFATSPTIPTADSAVSTGPRATGGSLVATTTDGQSLASQERTPTSIVVHVAGAVRRPGLVELRLGDRVDAAIKSAGGQSADADLHRLNLAILAEDGMQIVVPTVDDESAGPLVVFGSGSVKEPKEAIAPATININLADASGLQSLPGIGPSLAAAIVEWRTLNGAFVSPDDLIAVSGIGPAKLAGLIDFVTV